MHLKRTDVYFLILLVIISLFTVLDLFVNTGRSANMDGLIHITTIAQFTKALQDGDFPVRWLDGFANYGMPIGIFAQQLTSYTGAFINLFFHDPVLSFNIISLLAVVLSSVFFYLFLRIYFLPITAFLGAFLVNLAPYRILDLYIRGAIPETFSLIFFPLILISIYYLTKKKRFFAVPLLIISTALLALSHPMMFVIQMFVIVPYIFWNILSEKHRVKTLFLIFGLMFLGTAIAGYYYIPLELEIKYFFYGLSKNQLVPNQTLSLQNFIDPNWYYFMESRNDIFSRGHVIEAGLPEMVGVVIGLIIVLIHLVRYKLRFLKKLSLFDFAVILCVPIIFLTTKYSEFIYKHFNLLSNIQFPWRMFSVFIFLPPIIFAYFSEKINRNWLTVLFILFIALIRFPQLYGKNYTLYPQNTYYFTTINLHSNNMNTIWTGQTDLYPVENKKGAIIEGRGSIVQATTKNSVRMYIIDAKTKLRMVDYTFYFPGWHVYVDGSEVPIQFQDPDYRGTITYNVPAGKHTILVQFKDTKVRVLGDIISITAILLFGALILFERKIQWFEKFERLKTVS